MKSIIIEMSISDIKHTPSNLDKKILYGISCNISDTDSKFLRIKNLESLNLFTVDDEIAQVFSSCDKIRITIEQIND